MPFTSQEKVAFDALCKKAVSLKDGDDKLVSIFWKMLDMARKADLTIDVEIPPWQVGVHPQNRGGKKMSAVTMQKKGHKIAGVGFAYKFCDKDRAIAFAVNPSSDHIESHTLSILNSSDYFGSIKKGTLRAGSVGCGHLNQWLLAFPCGATSYYKDLCFEGKAVMSKDLITDGENAEELKVAITRGLLWTVLSYELEVMFPKLPSIFQRALNVEHHVGEGRSRSSLW